MILPRHRRGGSLSINPSFCISRRKTSAFILAIPCAIFFLFVRGELRFSPVGSVGSRQHATGVCSPLTPLFFQKASKFAAFSGWKGGAKHPPSRKKKKRKRVCKRRWRFGATRSTLSLRVQFPSGERSDPTDTTVENATPDTTVENATPEPAVENATPEPAGEKKLMKRYPAVLCAMTLLKYWMKRNFFDALILPQPRRGKQTVPIPRRAGG